MNYFMKKQNEKFYKYPASRDVVFVFGAGASYDDGAPLQGEILPIIMSSDVPDIQNTKIGQMVRDFIADNFAWNPDLNIYPTLETVFGFLDYFISQDEHLNEKYSNPQIRIIKESLIKLIHHVISVKSNKQSRTYRSFWELVGKYNRNISMLTLNYDTLLEQAFDFMFPDLGYIDYCIHLMNYENNLPGKTKAYNRWINPREPLPVNETNEANKVNDPVAIKIMKAHGSLNWKYCNCCNQVLLTPWDTKINLFNDELGKQTDHTEKRLCPIDASEFETLIIPPSYIKKISHPIISQILNEALREIRSCKKIVFVGYSFPDADVHFKALFKKSLTSDKQILVVNNSKKKNLPYNYIALTEQVKFLKLSFADLINEQAIMKDMLTQFR